MWVCFGSHGACSSRHLNWGRDWLGIERGGISSFSWAHRHWCRFRGLDTRTLKTSFSFFYSGFFFSLRRGALVSLHFPFVFPLDIGREDSNGGGREHCRQQKERGSHVGSKRVRRAQPSPPAPPSRKGQWDGYFRKVKRFQKVSRKEKLGSDLAAVKVNIIVIIDLPLMESRLQR